MELEIYEALTAANVPPEKAKAAAASIDAAIDRRYSLHSQQLATRGDVAEVMREIGNTRKEMAEMESRLLRAMADMQRWTLTSIFGGLAALAVLIKLWP